MGNVFLPFLGIIETDYIAEIINLNTFFLSGALHPSVLNYNFNYPGDLFSVIQYNPYLDQIDYYNVNAANSLLDCGHIDNNDKVFNKYVSNEYVINNSTIYACGGDILFTPQEPSDSNLYSTQYSIIDMNYTNYIIEIQYNYYPTGGGTNIIFQAQFLDNGYYNGMNYSNLYTYNTMFNNNIGNFSDIVTCSNHTVYTRGYITGLKTGPGSDYNVWNFENNNNVSYNINYYNGIGFQGSNCATNTYYNAYSKANSLPLNLIQPTTSVALFQIGLSHTIYVDTNTFTLLIDNDILELENINYNNYIYDMSTLFLIENIIDLPILFDGYLSISYLKNYNLTIGIRNDLKGFYVFGNNLFNLLYENIINPVSNSTPFHNIFNMNSKNFIYYVDNTSNILCKIKTKIISNGDPLISASKNSRYNKLNCVPCNNNKKRGAYYE